ncbi:MAG: hypothetical protein ABUL73_03165 [Alphaproteobacteria bacterium]
MRMIGKLIAATTMLTLASFAQAQTTTQAPAQAQSSSGGDNIMSHMINAASAGNWSFRPDRPRPQVVPSNYAQFNQALRMHVAHPTPNPWDAQASSPVGAAIKQGDVILVALYARAQEPATGASLPISIQLGDAPYTTLISGERHVTGDWAQVCISGVAGQDLPVHSFVNVNLGTATQTIDFGPVLVFDFGPGFDQTRLPNCNQ